MKRLLIAGVALGILLCILAAVFGVGNPGIYLYNLGAVLALASGVAAMCAGTRDPLKGHQK